MQGAIFLFFALHFKPFESKLDIFLVGLISTIIMQAN